MSDFSNWMVIIVEDTYDDVMVATHLLEYHGVTVKVAQNGEECMAILNTEKPTAILTDLAMPSMDGWGVLKAVRSNPATAHIPVIAMTAYHSAEVAEEARQVQFDGYIPKPLNPMLIMGQLEQAVTG